MFEALVLAAALAQTASTSPLCRTAGACRHVNDVVIRRPDGPPVEIEVSRELPWIDANGVLGLYSGDVVVLTLQGEATLIPKLVATARAAATRNLRDGELRVRFVQGGDFQNRIIVESKLPKSLHFNVVETVVTTFEDVASEQIAPDICVVRAGGTQPQEMGGLATRVGLVNFTYADRAGCYTELRRR